MRPYATKLPRFHFPHLPERRQSFEQLANLVGAGALEGAGDGFGGDGGGGAGEGGADGLDLLGEGFRPEEFGFGGDFDGLFFAEVEVVLGDLRAVRLLVFRAQPADQALLFFPGPLATFRLCLSPQSNFIRWGTVANAWYLCH